MSSELFTEKDRDQMERLGISQAKVETQLDMFRRGPHRLRLHRPCTLEDGIVVVDATDEERLLTMWATGAAEGRLREFLPASGAATRMFAFVERTRKQMKTTNDETNLHASFETSSDLQSFNQFVGSLRDFAFAEPLQDVMAKAGVSLQHRLDSGKYKEILDFLLGPQGLNYLALPKALIPFHRYSDHIRTALEEHLVEASHTVRDSARRCRVHFTVAPDSEEIIVHHGRKAAAKYGEKLGVQYELSFSLQKPASNTLAVDQENRPFRLPDGSLLFRPAGHGALLDNLNQVQGDIVFIKNIDNVVTDDLRDPVVYHQKVLAGMLLDLQQEVFRYLRLLQSGSTTATDVQAVAEFVAHRLSVSLPDDSSQLGQEERVSWLYRILNRPLRVCGMVKNRGEPGGGPFWVQEASGRVSLQIVEGAQVDRTSPEQVEIFSASTHFNPVLLVCGLRDFQGQPFDLHDFVDSQAVFIAQKTEDGRELKALELPGLWNGGMAYWNTVFVQVPEETFNPVKTINDLLRPGHHSPGEVDPATRRRNK
ncbi:MAG: DUF4301 family protein [Deltaproteobacteria bacterium]|nr:MAG: DUF4301 family protein [Deltaproteobacteria bacterium]